VPQKKQTAASDRYALKWGWPRIFQVNIAG
jgi:hypothetical protein